MSTENFALSFGTTRKKQRAGYFLNHLNHSDIRFKLPSKYILKIFRVRHVFYRVKSGVVTVGLAGQLQFFLGCICTILFFGQIIAY